MALALPKSKLYEANANSATVWQSDLIKLFHHAKERYADVVWELVPEDESEGEEVWGHKAIVYARAPTSFQALYFSFRPAPSATPDLYGDDMGPDESSFSLQLDPPSPVGSLLRDTMNAMRGTSPTPSNVGGILRLRTSINPALFSNELEYLYTAQGMGEAFQFLFDAPENRDVHESEENRRDKLRKDLTYMWRSRLFSDVRIALTGDFRPPDSAADTEDTAVVFFSHRFILVSRSPYFHKALQSNFAPPTAPIDGTMMTLQLPPTAFTPASLHWALGFMYAGTLNFSHRTFDLDTAFAIVRSAAYLLMNTMSFEIEAHIVEEMLHGLFHAYLTFDEYEKITAGKWGVGGCRCRQCQRRVPRVLEFSLAPDIGNKILERGSRRALVGMFGEGWCSSEFAGLSTKMRALLLKGVQTRTTPQNIFPLIFAAEAALARLDVVNDDSWRDTVHELIIKARKTIDECLDDQAETAFEQQEWLEIMDSDGQQFQDMDRVGWIMDSVIRGLKDSNTPLVYQVLVSSVLLRPHSTDTTATLLPNNSPVRARVEETRTEVLRWLKKHWIQVRLVGGFDALEPWALKEISHELEMNIPDLLAPPNTKGATTRTGLQVTMPKDKIDSEAEGASITATSVRASVLNRNLAKSNATKPDQASTRELMPPVRISLQSRNRETTTDNDTHSLALSTSSFSSARSGQNRDTSSVTSAVVTQKLTGATFSRTGTLDSVSSVHHREPTVTNPPSRHVPARRNVNNNVTAANDSPAAARPRSVAASVKSTTSTIRRGGASASNTAVSPTSPSSPSPNVTNNTLKVRPEPRRSAAATSTTAGTSRSTPRVSAASNLSRPSSRVSDVSGSFKSARSELDVPPVPRPRTTSVASTTSNRSMKTDGGSTTAVGRNTTAGKTRGNLIVSTPRALRPRKTSDASVISTASLSNPRGNVTPKRPSSQASVRSTVSTKSVSTKRQTPTKPAEKVPDIPKRTTKVSLTSRAVKKPTVTPPAVPPSPAPAPATPPTAVVETKPQEEPVVAPAVVIHVDDEGPETPHAPPVPPKESNRDTLGSLGGGLTTSAKDKRPSATSTMSTNSESTIRLTRKRSNDTITGTEDVNTLRAGALAKLIGTSSSPAKPSAVDVLAPPVAAPSRPVAPPVVSPPRAIPVPIPRDYGLPYSSEPNGITLNVGIPCIITSKRARFRAFARYLGEIVGERGPWIGVEVPLNEFAGGDKLEGRDWHDGSWNGVRYFDISGSGWEDDRGMKRRRMDPFGPGWRSRKDVDSLSVDQRSTRRMRSVSPAPSEGSTYESRGLFVRPQQVLYVVDARADY